MKTILFRSVIFACILVSFGCSKGNDSLNIDPTSESLEGTWKLKSSENSFKTESAAPVSNYEKTLEFNTSDSTFKKTYKTEDNTLTANGTFSTSVEKIYDTSLLLISLKYSESSNLIESCLSMELIESYYLRTDGKMYGTWQMCDGPTLIFGR